MEFHLNTQLIKYREKTLVKTLVSANALREGHIDDVIVAYAYHHVALTLHDGLDGSHTRAAGQDAVACRRRAATLQVTEDGHAHVELGELLLHAVGIIKCTTLRTLRDNDDARLLRLADAATHECR